MRWPAVKSGGLGVVAMTYVAVDYLRILSPTWHERLQPVLWSLLALVAVTRVPFYRHWSAEFRAAISFLASMIFMLSALLFEACTVRFVTVVLGLNWHKMCFH
ncbi:Sphingomyelin synthetase family protein isoform 4 [Gossypium australe]|uniref:Sphingomyelin synthetase family protein isoform 4 n=1 Tax=Gossypium australe TaxID=47621 RepID=A0A5B6UGT3_9ROSI|nr:Sphingomyelin synthetase family protein isoform 4 [Gossypium australe]